MITASYTTASVESLTRREIIERFLRETGIGDYGVATGGGTGYLIDTSMLQSSQYSPDLKPGAWLRVSYDAAGAGGAPEGEVRPVTEFQPGNGRVNVSPVFSAAVAANDRYQLWRFLHPQRVLDTLDQIMTQDCYLPYWTLLTEVPDGDMEQVNTTDWTATNATIAKATAEPQMWGKRYMTVLTTSAGGYVAPATTIRVRPNKKYHLSALVRCAASGTTAQLVAYDASNGAAISTKETDSQANVRLWMEFTTPADCHLLSIRLGSSENAKTTAWSEVVLYCMEASDIALPWWVKDKTQVKGIFRARFTDAGDNLWDRLPRPILDPNRWDFVDSPFGRGQMRLVSKFSPPQDPVLIMGTRSETAFASENDDPKRVDGNWIAACLNYRVFQQLKRLPNAGVMNMEWIRESFEEFAVEFRQQSRRHAQRLEDAMQAEQLDTWVYANNDSSYPGSYPTQRVS